MEKVNKEDFVRLLSQESGFTIQDTGLFLEAFIKVIEKCVRTRTPVDIRGLFHLSFTKIPAHQGFDATRGLQQYVPETLRIVMSLAKNLKYLVRRDASETS